MENFHGRNYLQDAAKFIANNQMLQLYQHIVNQKHSDSTKLCQDAKNFVKKSWIWIRISTKIECLSIVRHPSTHKYCKNSLKTVSFEHKIFIMVKIAVSASTSGSPTKTNLLMLVTHRTTRKNLVKIHLQLFELAC